MNIKPTSAEITIYHTIISACLASISAALTVAAQFYYAHGQNLWLAIVFFATTLLGSFGAMRAAVLHAAQTSPALPQAEQDAKVQAEAVGEHILSQLGPWFQSHFFNVSSMLKSMETALVNHTHASLPSLSVPVPQPGAAASTAKPQFTGGVIQSGQISLVNDGGTVAITPSNQSSYTNMAPVASVSATPNASLDRFSTQILQAVPKPSGN